MIATSHIENRAVAQMRMTPSEKTSGPSGMCGLDLFSLREPIVRTTVEQTRTPIPIRVLNKCGAALEKSASEQSYHPRLLSSKPPAADAAWRILAMASFSSRCHVYPNLVSTSRGSM